MDKGTLSLFLIYLGGFTIMGSLSGILICFQDTKAIPIVLTILLIGIILFIIGFKLYKGEKTLYPYPVY